MIQFWWKYYEKQKNSLGVRPERDWEQKNDAGGKEYISCKGENFKTWVYTLT